MKIIDRVKVQAKETTRIFLIFRSSSLALASATYFEMAIGRPNWVMFTTRKSVGKAIIYKPTPSSADEAGDDNTVNETKDLRNEACD